MNEKSQNTKPAIVMQTDFTKDISTCTMEGVCMMVDPTLRTFDSTHNIPSFSTYAASCALAFIVDYWPAGTVFVSVVDPGVGTSRKACVALLKNGSYVVTPDNGSLTHMFGIRVLPLSGRLTNPSTDCPAARGSISSTAVMFLPILRQDWPPALLILTV